MKPSATGRIMLWRGGSLWIGNAGEPAHLHAHHAVQIALPFAPGRLRFQIPSGEWQSYDAAIVAAHQPHAFEARDQFMAMMFVEPESREGRALHLRARDDGVPVCDPSSRYIQARFGGVPLNCAPSHFNPDVIGEPS